MKYYHIKGIHPAIGFYNPFKFWNKKDIKFEVQFNDSCKYELSKRDQKDWNKLFGVDFTPLTPANKPTSIMVAWRYYNSTFQLGLYAHTEEVPRILPDTVISSIKGKFNGVLKLTKSFPGTLLEANDKVTEAVEWKLLNNPTKGRIINPWFGGSKTPPHNMNFNLKFQ